MDSSGRIAHPAEALIRQPTAGRTAPVTHDSPILLPSENVKSFIEEFNQTYARIGWRIETVSPAKSPVHLPAETPVP